VLYLFFIPIFTIALYGKNACLIALVIPFLADRTLILFTYPFLFHKAWKEEGCHFEGSLASPNLQGLNSYCQVKQKGQGLGGGG